jgi:hypothetical protein
MHTAPTPSPETTPPSPTPAASPTDDELCRSVAADYTKRGVPCEPADVMFARGLMAHVDALLRADPTAVNALSKKLCDVGDSFGMTSAIVLGKLVRELRATDNEREHLALVAVGIVHVLGALTFRRLPKWKR